MVELKFNDIDIYHCSFNDGEIIRGECKWANIEGINTEVNLIHCENLNVQCLVENLILMQLVFAFM